MRIWTENKFITDFEKNVFAVSSIVSTFCPRLHLRRNMHAAPKLCDIANHFWHWWKTGGGNSDILQVGDLILNKVQVNIILN